jgi:hypothetical protein
MQTNQTKTGPITAEAFFAALANTPKLTIIKKEGF